MGLLAIVPGSARAWGPHPDITRAALQALPEADHWKQVLGGEFGQLTNYSWLPDWQGLELGDYSADDYLLIRAVPRYVLHGDPQVRETWRPFFLRALQALRTETPPNAARQMGPIIHWIEDTGAPPHAATIVGDLHGPLENWVPASEIAIPGYAPQLLGPDDGAAVAGLTARLEGLVAFSLEGAKRAKPLAEQGEAARAQVEPILLESALECARVLADALHTLFTLAEAPQPPGAGLRGGVTAGPFHPGAPKHMDKSARLLLLDDARFRNLGAAPACLAPALTDFGTNAYAVTPQPASGSWQGSYEFRNLPPGVYRVWAYRPGSMPRVSAPVTLVAGQTTAADIVLPPDDPPGNIIRNPHGDIAVLSPQPDRWTCYENTRWVSRSIPVQPGLTYRVGAVLKDPQAKVTLTTVKVKPPNPQQTLASVPGSQAVQELRIAATDEDWTMAVQVETTKPLSEAIDRVWVAPVP
jgi:hypothetical protein